MPVPIDPNEVYIGDTYFPTKGPVRVTNITVTPTPVLFGDTSRQGETQMMSQIVQSSNTGGSGIYKANNRVDIDRVWTSRAETRYRQTLTLPPLAVDMSKPASLTTEDAAVIISFANEVYVSFANKVFRWQDVTANWSALDKTLTSTPSDAVVFNSKLYMAYGTGYSYRTAGVVNWTDVATAATLLTVWDNKLWRLAAVSGGYSLYYSTDGTTWSAVQGTIPAEVVPHQLVIYRDAAGDSAIYVVTDVGLFIHDSANLRILQTEVRIPQMSRLQKARAVVFRDGKLYVNTGDLGALSVQAGNPFIVTPVGLDTEDGVPSGEAAAITYLTADYNWILALLDTSTVSTGSDDQISGLGGPFDSEEWTELAGTTTLRAWNQGWHTLWESEGGSHPGYAIHVSSAYDKRRVYWACASKTFYMDLPSGIYNPRHNPNQQFATGPVSHTTPWFDAGTEGQQKIQGHLALRTTGCSATETVTVYYGTDLDDSTWTLLGTIQSNGLTELRPGDEAGVQMRHVRFRFDLQRGSDPTKRPIVEYWTSDFMRILPAQYGYSVELDLTKPHRGLSPLDMIAALDRLVNPLTTSGFYPFVYQDLVASDTHTSYGRISRISGMEFTGATLRSAGTYMVTVMVPYHGDAIPGG